MLPHPHLWPALIAAAIGLPLIVWSCVWYARRWSGFTLSKRVIFGIIIALFETVYWLNVYAWLIEPNRLVVREVAIESAHWQGAPLKIAMISDTHVAGPHVRAERIERLVSRVNALDADIVVLLGDYVAGHAPEAEREGAEQAEILRGIAPFAALDAPLGVVAVIGNHDVWYNRSTITQALQDAGVATLWNRNVEIARDGGAFVVAGLADDTTDHPDFTAALDGAPAIDTIIISHSPDPFVDAPDNAALMLAGHGHCGQVTIPLIGRPILPLRHREFACGRTDRDGRTLYVTGGIGTSILPVRFLNPPEIVVLTLSGAGGVQSASLR